MEDAHSVELGYAGNPDSAYFAVFDGHGGAKFAKHCGDHLSRYLQADPSFSEIHTHTYTHTHTHTQEHTNTHILADAFE